MSEKVELELLRRLEVMANEREEALSDIETLKLHVDTLREAAQSAASEVMRLRAERDALAGEASSIEQNVGALLDLYHARMIESEHQEKLAWERAAEKDRAYGEALAELDEERAEADRWRNAHHEASIRLQAHDCGEEAAKFYERAGRAEEAVTKLGEQLNASEADCERLCKLLDDCRNVLLGQYDPDSVNAMIHRIDDAIGPWEALEKPSKEKRDG